MIGQKSLDDWVEMNEKKWSGLGWRNEAGSLAKCTSNEYCLYHVTQIVSR